MSAKSTALSLTPPPRLLLASCALASGAFVLGGLLDVAFRPTSLVMFQWCDRLRLTPSVHQLRLLASTVRPRLAPVVIFAVPNGLWLLSYCLVVSAIWGGRARRVAIGWMALLWALAVTSEFLQRWGWLRGTFDWQDVAAYSCAFVVGALWRINGSHD